MKHSCGLDWVHDNRHGFGVLAVAQLLLGMAAERCWLWVLGVWWLIGFKWLNCWVYFGCNQCLHIGVSQRCHA